MPHAIPSTVTNAKTTSAPSQKSGSDGGDSGPPGRSLRPVTESQSQASTAARGSDRDTRE